MRMVAVKKLSNHVCYKKMLIECIESHETTTINYLQTATNYL